MSYQLSHQTPPIDYQGLNYQDESQAQSSNNWQSFQETQNSVNVHEQGFIVNDEG